MAGRQDANPQSYEPKAEEAWPLRCFVGVWLICNLHRPTVRGRCGNKSCPFVTSPAAIGVCAVGPNLRGAVI